jgi:exopolysaccharide biosynthesis polyprenyl glycosylphosphotransferase
LLRKTNHVRATASADRGAGTLRRIARLRPHAPLIADTPEFGPAIVDRDRRYRYRLAIADALSALTALVLCASLAGGGHVQLGVLLGLPLAVLASKLRGLYDRDPLLVRKTTLDEAPALFQLATLYTLIVWVADAPLLGAPLGKVQGLVLWASLFTFALTFRRIARLVASRRVPAERLLMIGDADSYARIDHKLEMGAVNAKLVGRMSLRRVSDLSVEERPVDEATLADAIRSVSADRILVVPSQTNPQVTLDIIRATKALGVRVSIVPHVFDVVGHSVVFDDLGGMTLLGVREFALARSSGLIKRALDLAGAIAGLTLVGPFLLLAALAIKLDTPGPVFFRQERIGRHGRSFRIFKLRTMVADAEARKLDLEVDNEARGLFKIADDPRITRVGRILRKTSLDELPQLLNVLLGEMSLVGPRPLIASEDVTITGYDRRRLALTPGMTGHWQIMGSARVPMHEMVKIDYLYVTTWSLFGDLKILLRTVPYMLARRGQ